MGKLVILGHRICWRGDWIAMAFSRLFFRYYCPYPLDGNYRARDCVRSGQCGCNNKPRYQGSTPTVKAGDAK